MTSIFVAKLDFGVDNQQLSSLFETYGKVNKATVALDRETGKSRGFGFVEMPNDGEAQEAIKNLDGFQVNGRPIAVKQAEDRSNSRPARPSNDGPRRDSRPAESAPSPRQEFTRPGAEEPTIPFIPETGKEVRKKTPKSPQIRENEGPKVKKMEAYRKSGKDNLYLDDDDDFDEEEIDLFGRNEDDDLDEDYSKYLVNASDDDDEYEDDDYEDDEEYEDDDY
jgi:RNA recognition motif-containing protein